MSWVDLNKGEPVFKIAGMPVFWKVISFLVSAFPKLFIWLFTMRSGVMFLMETADIQNTIVNTTALFFILQLDESVFDVFTPDTTKLLMSALESHVAESQFAAHEGDEQVMKNSGAIHWNLARPIPQTFVFCVVLWIALVVEYYYLACVRSEDGTWVSIPVYLPKSTDLNIMSAFLPYVFPVESEDKPYWTMPEESGA
eukprot:gnl/TRDRNA2_/TRDRNA2_153200_c1_seq3.p1 gnl/TRDRNA2_/TRDRNA2_153200_c1~~gnl/TRDRNA2_/TRDRNA2_153200_c1_seq3.p1  ORF type:complete len:218 (+),score=28.55 gnl/TRDRNA2_/TRDRNA2_153200_c1_seq3:62-655(+)